MMDLLGSRLLKMAARVPSYRTFRQKLHSRASCDLFGFLLFDDRPSHEPVRSFCSSNFKWLDALADSNRLVLFLPIRATARRVGAAWACAEAEDGYQNCSLEIADQFHLGPNQLPAFLLFTLKDGSELCVEHSVWLQFKPEAFSGDAIDGQDLISDLFSAVNAARRRKLPHELILKLQGEIDRVKQAQSMRPLKKWIRRQALNLQDLPSDIARTLANAGVTAVAGANK
jgi:hypothetical protein